MYETITRLRCDQPDCEREFRAKGDESARTLFARARRAGWLVGDPDLCPIHNQTAQQTEERRARLARAHEAALKEITG